MAEELARDVPRYPMRPLAEFSEVLHRPSWSAVWAGVMIALGMEILFTFFGLFIGFRMYDFRAANPWRGISGWTTIWYFVTVGWSMFFGAWCAARLSGDPARESGRLHGITVWGLASILSIGVVTFGAWSVMREEIDLLRTAAVVSAQVAPEANRVAPGAFPEAPPQGGAASNPMPAKAGPVAQATANTISRLALGVWIGVLIGFITALWGGAAGQLRRVLGETQQTPGPTTRLAA
jgi:hypothetical protein